MAPGGMAGGVSDAYRSSDAWPLFASATDGGCHVTLDEALAIILGPEVADAISLKQGRHWAVVAAVARATTDQNPEAIAVLRAHVAEQKRRTEQS